MTNHSHDGKVERSEDRRGVRRGEDEEQKEYHHDVVLDDDKFYPKYESLKRKHHKHHKASCKNHHRNAKHKNYPKEAFVNPKVLRKLPGGSSFSSGPTSALQMMSSHLFNRGFTAEFIYFLMYRLKEAESLSGVTPTEVLLSANQELLEVCFFILSFKSFSCCLFDSNQYNDHPF